ncbi:hypothetical protein AUC69_03490 [Methyloceanibacter superfactus]|uniref:Uncharacterized protein n=1 Tax=Methyloceanibacter superfactus TaxID=1774969 RepID=A0A1E3VL22_9HYPH|nr:hypothetical protein [Methyloceanibacter superfactus]ODR94224.1 hypothetical protein AUC69_03490 [Methyloceanibacter superfactus]
MADAPPRVRFYYLKSTQFRAIHVDGAIGGITPRGLIHASVYSERPAIPQSQEHEVAPEGRLLDPIDTEGKLGIVRELDVDLIMSKQAAAELRDWLTKRIEELDEIQKKSKGAGGKTA